MVTVAAWGVDLKHIPSSILPKLGSLFFSWRGGGQHSVVTWFKKNWLKVEVSYIQFVVFVFKYSKVIYIYSWVIWVFPKIMGKPPKSSNFNRDFHYKPSILGVFPLFLGWHPYTAKKNNSCHFLGAPGNSLDNIWKISHLANGPWKKSLNFIFPTKYGIPKSLKG